ncbi:MAG TPA: ATP-binding protein [Acidimicrobiales bacterium]|nr:ATP-binding protein [Acidimicrobiales bacterium]
MSRETPDGGQTPERGPSRPDPSFSRAGDDDLRLLIESTVEYAFIALDRDGNITGWNAGAERLKGYRAKEVLGRHFSMFYPPEVPRNVIDDKLGTAIAEGSYTEEGWRVRKDGSRFWAHVTITPLRNRGGELRGFGKVTRDLTERKQAEDEIRAALEREKQAQAQLVAKERLSAVGEWASLVSHELRNQLALLSNIFFLVRHELEQRDGEEELLQELTVADRQIERSVRIVSGILEFARAGAANKAPCDIDAIADEILRTAHLRGNIEVAREQEPGMMVMADANQISQVLLNLIVNAADAMPDGGKLTVATKYDSGSALIIVADTGLGISQATLPEVFRPFFTTRSTGTGLGLAVVKQIVEAHDGGVTVDSVEGAGTTFTVRLPRATISEPS